MSGEQKKLLLFSGSALTSGGDFSISVCVLVKVYVSVGLLFADSSHAV